VFDAHHPEAVDAIRRALAEDIGAGDITTQFTVPAARRATGAFYAREPMTVAGTELLATVYELQGGVDSIEIVKHSGELAGPGDCLARVAGLARTLLTCERTALNFIQRLSGVATLAAAFAAEVEGTNCRVLDTRKTTPGLRRLEKMAAEAGGIVNHRIGLFDAILIKNNHIAAAGGVKAALAAVSGCAIPVEIEVRTREELDEALANGATRLLLDNLTPAEAGEWIAGIRRRAGAGVVVELSGGITLETARAYALAGADFLSAGAITHSARALDINFRLTLAG
jgi:nicotinate-nucleotide pyrophosphorylase (carboxylating)